MIGIFQSLLMKIKNRTEASQFVSILSLPLKAFMNTLKYLMEKRIYGVCAYLGDKMEISSERIRLYFIYVSFLTFGSPLFVYLVVAFWLNLKNYIQEKRSSIWDL